LCREKNNYIEGQKDEGGGGEFCKWHNKLQINLQRNNFRYVTKTDVDIKEI